MNWASVRRYGTERDSLARMVMDLAGADYAPEHAFGSGSRRAALVLTALSGQMAGPAPRNLHWSGTLLLSD